MAVGIHRGNCTCHRWLAVCYDVLVLGYISFQRLDHADQGGAEDNKELKKRKTLVDGPLITDAVSSYDSWSYQTMVLFAEDVMVVVRALGRSCPCYKMEATSKYMRLVFVHIPFPPCMYVSSIHVFGEVCLECIPGARAPSKRLANREAAVSILVVLEKVVKLQPWQRVVFSSGLSRKSKSDMSSCF